MPRSLKNDISISEMLYMREQEHMSNAQIAACLDISTQTVWRYIGPQFAEGEERPRKTPKKEPIRSVGQAMLKAFNTKQKDAAPKRSIQACNTCANRGIACSLCWRNPYLKDYFSKEGVK